MYSNDCGGKITYSNMSNPGYMTSATRLVVNPYYTPIENLGEVLKTQIEVTDDAIIPTYTLLARLYLMTRFLLCFGRMELRPLFVVLKARNLISIRHLQPLLLRRYLATILASMRL